MDGFYCNSCGQYHDHLPMDYSFAAPVYWSEEFAGDDNSELGEEHCVIQDEDFFIKGNLEIPISDSNDILVYTIWVSLSPTNFDRVAELWDDPKRIEEEPCFGWFSTRLPGYPDTTEIKTKVHTREVGLRPYIELEPTDHSLAIEQREGITMERVKEIAQLLIHPD